MARCPKCGTQLGPNARFCSICGTEAVAPTATTQQAPVQNPGSRPAPYVPPGTPTTSFGPSPADADAAGKKKIAIAAGAGAALVAIAGLIFLSASGLLGAKKPETKSAGVLTAPPTETVQAPVLTAPAAQPPAPAPVMQAPPPQGNPMPPEVIDYLRWLKRFEAGRLQLEAKGEAQMTLVLQELTKTMLTGPPSMGLLDPDPEEASRRPPEQQPKALDMTMVNQVIQDWNQANAIFQQKLPPDPCATLALNYLAGLQGGVQQMTQLVSITNNAIAAISGNGGRSTAEAQNTLNSLFTEKNTRGKSQSVDSSFAQSNAALDALRAQYTDIPPDIDRAQFTIKHGGGGMNIPIPGLGM
jgi:Type IV secretory pathway, VirJ component